MRIFSINDVETTHPTKQGQEFGPVFDYAWVNVDENGNEYGNGSYVFPDVMATHKPYFSEKIDDYVRYIKEGLIKPVLFNEARRIYNEQIDQLQKEGHEVLFCSYNGKFDTDALSETAKHFGHDRFLTVKMHMFCIWHFWSMHCPLDYKSKLSKSGKFYSTNAEDVYKFEFGAFAFVEEHIAFSDIKIEKDILLKVLQRSKELPIVKTKKDLDVFIPEVSHRRFSNWTRNGFKQASGQVENLQTV